MSRSLVGSSSTSTLAGRAGRVRYRYYVSRALQHGGDAQAHAGSGARLPAREIESAVVERIAEALADPLGLAAAANLDVAADQMLQLTERSNFVEAAIRRRDRNMVRQLVASVQVLADRVDISISSAAIAEMLHVPIDDEAANTFALTSNIRVT